MKIQIGILFGGISNERNVSLNSARSVFDHLSNIDNTEISLIFVNKKEAFYKIEPRYIYSSSASDFDFKIDKIATKIALSKIKNECDIVLPILHGAFGEDGTIQKILKSHKINFIGSDEKSCEKMFYKTAAIDIMRRNEINVFDSIVIHKNDSIEKSVLKINNFLKQNGKVIIKPDNSGSSIDVFAANDVKEIMDFIKNHDYKTFLIEKFCKKGTEFTVSVLEKENNPIALVPSSVELKKGDIYDYSKKYLPTATVMVSQPAIFNLQTIETIQKEAIKIFKIFGAKDFLRIDGFYENGKIFFTDLNPICGMEQNGFFFQQISFIGISHRNAILNLMRMKMQKAEPGAKIDKKKVFVMMGGQSNEKNISILSGINIFLKLQQSAKYTPEAFFIDSKNKVYSLPDYILLNHTTYEIEHAIKNHINEKTKIEKLREKYTKIFDHKILYETIDMYEMNDFIKYAKSENAFIFLALHGGDGENGVMQKLLLKNKIRFNGSDDKTSKICINKNKTANKINDFKTANVSSLFKIIVDIETESNITQIFCRANQKLKSAKFIIKPMSEGSSNNIKIIQSASELSKYFINKTTGKYVIEKFIKCDTIDFSKNHPKIINNSGWIEITVGIIQTNNKISSMNPSITISKSNILTLKEKFEPGSGINIDATDIIKESQIEFIKTSASQIAKKLNLKDYARIDMFFNYNENKIIIIEINTLPAMSPSTVLYSQALLEKNIKNPLGFIEKIISD